MREQRDSIFISYRRSDSAGHAGRIYDRLSARFGAERIFMDVDSIAPGSDFPSQIEGAIGSCAVLVAVIGKQWRIESPAEPSGGRPVDYVVLEISLAIEAGIAVIPVLVQDALMPPAEALPKEIRTLARRQALALDDTRWDTDVQQLTGAIERALPPDVQADGPATRGRRTLAVAAALLLIGGIAAGAIASGLFDGPAGEEARGPTTAVTGGDGVSPDGGETSPTSASEAGPCAYVADSAGIEDGSGSTEEPFGTVSDLISALRPGETGCLRGTFEADVVIQQSGSLGSAITLQTYPGAELAVIDGSIDVQADHVTIQGIAVVSRSSGGPGLRIAGDAVRILGNDISAARGNTCVYIDHGRDVEISGNYIHDCGEPGVGGLGDVGVSAYSVDGLVVADNLIVRIGDLGLELYPGVHGSTIRGNTIVGTGEDVVMIGGTDAVESSHNVIVDNVLADATDSFLIQTSWDGQPGIDNTIADNCLWNPTGGAIGIATGLDVKDSNLEENPNLIDASAGDYRVADDSPCRGLGASPATLEFARARANA